MVYVCHQHYENNMSGANSYVEIFKEYQDAKQNMIDSIYRCISHCEEETMDKIADFLNTGEEVDIKIDEFNVSKFTDGYRITDKYEEGIYLYQILDTDAGDYENSF